MSYSKKDLLKVKQQLAKNNPGALKNLSRKSVTINKAKRSSDYKRKKSVVQWNFDVNDLVFLKENTNMSGCVGLIVSDYMYHTSRVEKNNFFVLVSNRVIQLDGRYLNKVWL